MKGAGALIWLLWNFMLPVFRTAWDAQLAGTVEIGVLLPLLKGITSHPQASDGAAEAADPFTPLNLGAIFLTPSNLKTWLKPC